MFVKISYGQNLPIKPTRTIKFETEVGSYLNIDISPNGKQLVFDLLGDIYTLPIDGGQAKQLTKGIALHTNPFWSKDGKAIIYQSDSLGSKQFFYRNVDSIRGISISDIHSINVLKKPNKAIPAILTQYYKLSITPDSTTAVYIGDGKRGKRNSLIAINLTTGEEKVLLSSPLLESIDEIFDQQFCFTPDSKFVIISHHGKIFKINLIDSSTYQIQFHVTVNVDLGPLINNKYKLNDSGSFAKYVRFGRFSPDESLIVFSTLNKIYVQNTHTGQARRLNNQKENQFQPAFSASGNQIVYASWNDTSGGNLWICSKDGRNAIKINKIPGLYKNPIWSPDDKSILVLYGPPVLDDRDDPGKGKLIQINLSNKKVKVIESNVPLWNNLNFSKDGKNIYYSPQDKKTNAFSTPLIAEKCLTCDNAIEKIRLQDITNTNGYKYFIQRSLSPDTRYLVYSKAEELFFTVIKDEHNSGVFSAIDSTHTIRFAKGVDPIWQNNGESITWTYGKNIYSLSVKKILKALSYRDLQDSLIKPNRRVEVHLKIANVTTKHRLALTNIHIIPMIGDEIIENGIIIIKDGKIEKVGNKNNITIPKGTKIMNLKGKTVMPGIIDLHCHMRMPADIIPQQSWMLLANLAYGVTTVRDPSSSLEAFGYAEAIASGQLIGPRLITVGRAVNPAFEIKINNQSQANDIVGQRKEYGAISVKQYLLLTRLQRQQLLLATEKEHINMTNEGEENILGQIAMLKDGSNGIEHNPIWGDAQLDVIKLYAFSKTYLTPALQVCYGTEPAKEYFKYKYWRGPNKKLLRFTFSNPIQIGPINTFNGAENYETITSPDVPLNLINPGFLSYSKIDHQIYELGGKIGLGSHGNDEGIGAHNEIWALEMGGFSKMDALKVATINGAEALGLDKELGSIKSGKIADLIILNSDPLIDIHNTKDIKYVVKGGIIYDGNTLNSIWPLSKKCPKWRIKKPYNFKLK